MSDVDDVLLKLREFFHELDHWVPGAGSFFVEAILIWPEARYERLFDLSDAYRAAAELYRDHVQELEPYLRDLDVWQGDGAAQVARDQLMLHFDEISGMADAVGAMQQMVHAKALEIESAVYMAIVNLIMVAIALVQLILLFWTGIGAISGAVQMAAGRVAISQIMKMLLTRMWQQTIKAGIRRAIDAGIKGAVKTGVRSGLVYAGFVGGTKAGITLVQALRGHDPFTEDFAGRFAREVVDGFIAGFIGGPLQFGIHSRLAGAAAFTGGTAASNLLQMGRDRLIDMAGGTEWASRNGLYSGMTWGTIAHGFTPAALLGAIVTDPSRYGRGLHADLAALQVRAGHADLFAPHAHTAHSGAQLPGALGDVAHAQAPGHAADGAGAPTLSTTHLTDPHLVGSASPASSSATSAAPAAGSRAHSTPTSAAHASSTSAGTTHTGEIGTRTTGESSTTSYTARHAEASPAHADPAHRDAAPVRADPTYRDAAPVDRTHADGTHRDLAPSDQVRAQPAHTSQTPDAPTRGETTPTVTSPETGGPRPDGGPRVDATAVDRSPTVDGRPPANTTSTVDNQRGAPVRSDTAHTTPPDATTARPDAPTTQPDASAPPPDATTARPDASAPPPDATTARPDAPTTRPDATRGDAQPSHPDTQGDGSPRREDPKFWEWKKRFEQHYGHAVADRFGPTSDAAHRLAAESGPRLTPDLVQRALDTPAESLNAYGNRLRSYLEQNFTRIDETGHRRPLDPAGIEAKLGELRGPTHSTATPAPRPTHEPPTAPEPTLRDGQATLDTPERAAAPDMASAHDGVPMHDGVATPERVLAPTDGHPTDAPRPAEPDGGSGRRPEADPTAVEPEQAPSAETAESRDSGESQDMLTGGSVRPADDAAAWQWAEHAYDRFRADNADVTDIANHLATVERPSGKVGFTPAEIYQIKQHLMVEPHRLDDYAGGHVNRPFDASPDIAEAWIRLRDGRPLKADIVLLEHELAESNYLKTHPEATYKEAHLHANRLHDWAEVAPGRTGESLDTSWGKEGSHGDTGRLPEGPGRQTGGGIHLRLPGDGSPPGHPEGDAQGDPAGWGRGESVPARADGDLEAAAQRSDLAGQGRLGVVEELAPSANFSPHVTRTGADLPQQVHELVDRAREHLLSRYPEHTVEARIRDLEAVGRVADSLQAAADRARATGDMHDVVQQVRELSSAVTEYSDRYRNWQDFQRGGEFADPGWRDLDGVDPLNSVEMAHRAVGIDPATHRFDPIDQAIAVAKIGDVLGPEFEAHALRTLERTIPMDMDSARALLPDAAVTPDIANRISSGRVRGFYHPSLDVTFVNHRAGTGARPISALAATVVHEGMHALQPSNRLLQEAIRSDVPPNAQDTARGLLRFEREFQSFAVQQEILRGLTGHRSPDYTADPRIPNTDGYREVAAMTRDQLRDMVLDRYIPAQLRSGLGIDGILARSPDFTPETIVAHARSSIMDAHHPLPSERQAGTLYGPMTRHVVDTHGLDLDGVRQRQGQLSFPALRDAPAGARAVRDGSADGEIGPSVEEERTGSNEALRSPDRRVGDAPTRTPAHARATSSIRDTGFVPDGRPERLSDVTVAEFRDAALRVSFDDFGAHSVVGVRPDGPLVRVETADGRVQMFEPTVGRHMDNVAETTLRTGTRGDPHVVRVNDRVAPEQLSRAWVHEIAETLHEDAAAHRSEPQGVVRRALNKVGGLFGIGEQPARPHLPETEPHTSARLAERRYLMREFDEALTAEEQVRLRQEIEGVDRDLTRLGHPVHELAPVPEVTRPTADAAPPPDRSTYDEIWTDPPWQREGRRPSLDELIPMTHEEAAKWEATVREEFARQFDGQEFGGARVRIDLADRNSVTVFRNTIELRADLVDPRHGWVGHVTEVFRRDYDDRLVIEHNTQRVSDVAQGRGVAGEWNRFIEEWARYSSVHRMEVHASWGVGGYAWARAGYDWAPNTEHRANAVLQQLRAEMRVIDDHVAQVGRWTAGDGSMDMGRLRQRYGVDEPDALLAEMSRQQQAGQQILDRAARNPFGMGDYPTPYEISRAGWNGQHGRDATWLGKEALLDAQRKGADWKGVKPVSEGGPFYPRSPHVAPDPAVPHPSAIRDLLSGVEPPHRPITAAHVPDSQFHGYGRHVPEPDVVQRIGREALDEIVGRLPAESPLRGVRLEVTHVAADSLPDRAVARSVPVDAHGADLPPGTVPPDGGGYRIELSDRATDLNIPRAVAHEVAELAAIRQRAADGLDLTVPDALRPGEFAAGSRLSPHDLGRLAEIEVLARMLGQPEHAGYARSELAALRDHLGLRPEDAPARQALVEAHLTDGARDALNRVGRLADLLSGPMAELRPYFPHQWVRVAFDSLRITTQDGTTVAIRVESGEVAAGLADISFDSRSREHVVVLSERLRPEDVVRTLVDRVATIFAAETGGRPDAGGLRQLDVLATERARIQYRLGHAFDVPVTEREAWIQEDARVTREFRAQAERLGILGPENEPDTNPQVRARRDEVWADLSDGARATVFTMADPNSAVGASAKARSFLPLTEEFRRPYNAIDSFTYFVETHLPAEVRQRFEAELMPRIREFQASALEQFKAEYRRFFPSTSAERPLPPDQAAAARETVSPLVDRTEGMLEEIRVWADSAVLPELRRDAFDRAVELGEQAWRERYEEYRAAADQLIARFDYLGEPLGYIGSMQDGMRGPHKAMAHADLRSFDLDLLVINPEDFDRRYDLVMENAPELISRGKIFPDPVLTPELYRLGQLIAEELHRLFPNNPDVIDSMIVLRREPPY